MSKVYFARCADFIKIGKSVDPEARLKSFSPWLPFPIELQAEVDGGIGLEKAIHREFASDRYRGEWFRITPRLLALIEDVKNGRPIAITVSSPARAYGQSECPFGGEPVRRALTAIGSRKKFCELLACGRPFLSRLEHGKRQIPVKKVLLVEEKTGVSRHDLRPDIFGVA